MPLTAPLVFRFDRRQRPPHLSRRMLEHYSHIRIDAKRQALDALDASRRSTAHNGDGNGDDANWTETPAIVEVGDDLTSQSRHGLVLRGSPPAAKLLIPSAFVRVEYARATAGCLAEAASREGRHLHGEMSEWLKEHAWKLLWRSARACYRFRLPLRSQLLSGDHVYSIDRRKHQ